MENPIDRGPWRATVHRVANSWTWLQWLSMHAHGGKVICAWLHIFVWCESKAYSRPVLDYTVNLQSYTVNVRIMLHIQSVQSLSHVWLCDSMNCSTPGLPVHHQLPEFTQTHVHWVDDAIQPSHSLSSTSPPSCLQSFPTSGSFQMSQFFTSSGQSIGISASTSVLPMNIQEWVPLGLTGLISLHYKGLSRVFSNTAIQKHQFFGAQLSL